MLKTIQGYTYKVNEYIGKGYSSTVHKGIKDSTNKEVSIKVIEMSKLEDPINQMLLQYEVSALKNLTFSEHVLHLYDVYATKNNTYLITELCEGDLSSLLKTRKQFPYHEAVEIIKQVILGYMDVHRMGYLHRDIKPANIFFTKKKRPDGSETAYSYKIGDFGFTISINEINKHKSYNVGSPVYMPPQALKKNIYSVSCDTWAIGVIFYQLLKGSVPWRAISEEKLYEKLTSEPLDGLTMGLPEVSRKFLAELLHLDPERRMKPKEMLEWVDKLSKVEIRSNNMKTSNISNPLLNQNSSSTSNPNISQTTTVHTLKQEKLPLQEVKIHSNNNSQIFLQPHSHSRSNSFYGPSPPQTIATKNVKELNNHNKQQQQKLLFEGKQNKQLLISPMNLSKFSNSCSATKSNIGKINNCLQGLQEPHVTKFYTEVSNLKPQQVLSANDGHSHTAIAKGVSSSPEQLMSCMIGYLKFLHRTLNFIAEPSQVNLKSLQDAVKRHLFKEMGKIQDFVESMMADDKENQYGGKLEVVGDCVKVIKGEKSWRQFAKGASFVKCRKKLQKLDQKYHMLHPVQTSSIKEGCILDIYKEQVVTGIQKIVDFIFSAESKSTTTTPMTTVTDKITNTSNQSPPNQQIDPKTVVTLDYLITFYQLLTLREEQNCSSVSSVARVDSQHLRFLERSKIDTIMQGNPYNVRREHIPQLRKKIELLGLNVDMSAGVKGMSAYSGFIRNDDDTQSGVLNGAKIHASELQDEQLSAKDSESRNAFTVERILADIKVGII